MDTNVNELGTTLLVGAAVILGLEAVLFYMCGWSLTGFFAPPHSPSGDKVTLQLPDQPTPEAAERAPAASAFGFESVGSTAIFVAASFGLGLLVEDVSLRLADDKPLPISGLFDRITEYAPSCMKSSFDLHPLSTRHSQRVALIVENKLADPATCRPGRHKHEIGDDRLELLAPTGLGKELASTSAFVAAMPYDAGRARELEQWILLGGPQSLTIDELESVIDRLYYYAKNTVYGSPNYFSELSRIQTRLDFSRSVAVLSFVYLGLTTGILCLQAAAAIRRRRPLSADRRLAAVGLMLAFFGVYFASVWAYHRESDEFNKRAFGYFSTLNIDRFKQLSH